MWFYLPKKPFQYDQPRILWQFFFSMIYGCFVAYEWINLEYIYDVEEEFFSQYFVYFSAIYSGIGLGVVDHLRRYYKSNLEGSLVVGS